MMRTDEEFFRLYDEQVQRLRTVYIVTNFADLRQALVEVFAKDERAKSQPEDDGGGR